MKLCLFTKLLLAIFFFLSWDTGVLALAGFAESDSILHYNNFANISWMHPGEGCHGYSPYGQYCFYLLENNSLANPSNKALQKISIPEDPNSHLILMEDTEGQWIVYDLKSKGNVFESNDFESALKRWKDFSFLSVNLANAANLSSFFEETEESKQKNTTSWSEFSCYLS